MCPFRNACHVEDVGLIELAVYELCKDTVSCKKECLKYPVVYICVDPMTQIHPRSPSSNSPSSNVTGKTGYCYVKDNVPYRCEL